MKIRDNTRYRLKNGEVRTVYIADSIHILVVGTGFIRYNEDGTTKDRKYEQYDILGQEITNTGIERRTLKRKV